MDGGRLKVVTIGAGYFAGFHVDSWLRNPDVAFAGLADLDRVKAEKLLHAQADAGHGIPVFDDVRTMLAEVEPDIVDIATPPASHHALLRLALGSNAKAITCQKPFCGSLNEAREAVAEIEAAGKLVVVHENFRFQPWYRTMRDEIAKGRLGDLYQISFRLRPGDGQGADAYLSRQPYFQEMPRFLIHETGVHWIDTFRFLLGEPDAVFADLRQLNPVIAGEDSGLFLYRYADGRRALFDGNRLVDHFADNPRLTMGECAVEGSAGVLFLDGFGSLSFRQNGGSDAQAIDLCFPRERFGGDCVHALQSHVSDHILHGTPIENEASAYLRNMEIEEAIYRSAASGQTVTLTQDGR